MAQILSSAPFIQADITFNEIREYPYLFDVTAFDDISMRWMIVCRIHLTTQTHEGYALCFRLMFDRCKKECPSFQLGKTLVGIVVDWSDVGLRDAVGEKLANQLLKGCQIHWMRSFHKIADKVCKIQHPERRKFENEAFKLIAVAIVISRSGSEALPAFMWRTWHTWCSKSGTRTFCAPHVYCISVQ